ncbi:alpha/beta fold hydrolase [Saccharopolyspora sp. HNM0983]|uniref:Alpha/beta fold hydrolase n=1 Tax=Saccharopolyspora montiporae TaxID=2781240 RepID=A0A929BBK9_9PSEU|nr:alpha/beta fold hydrolase [Saccharopolyspora sp. HNM0983]MBE9375355.1 alpha/beta fold hydrolase [Saccharopolyspora sp. HNM0983]
MSADRRTGLALIIAGVLAAVGGCAGQPDPPAPPPGAGPADQSPGNPVQQPPSEVQDQTPEEAKRDEDANALPRDGFYSAEPSGADPGTLLRAEPFRGWHLPPGMQGTRMVYESRSAEEQPVVTSGAVVTPEGEPPEGGWPVIGWAHGTSGVAPQCAPSLMKDLYYGDVLAEYVAHGYAVVATDYAGLGAGEGHEYDTMPANANDVRYSIAAAAEAVPGLGDRWVAAGHSQGGQAAWGAAKQQTADPVGELVGAVSLAPATRIDQAMPELSRTPGSAVYLPYLAYAIALQNPDFQPQDMLTDAGMQNYDRYVNDGCLPSAIALTGAATPAEYLKPEVNDNPAVQRLIEQNEYDTEPLDVPLFAVSGAQDTSVPADTVAGAADRQCGQETPVQYREYAGTHDSLVTESAEDQLQWIADRFAGQEPPDTCR